MPSCVMKWCKNNSEFQKKDNGITFHKLPGEILMKESWIKAIRDNRNEEDWYPSKYSVVCSTHFNESDIYFTKYGLRRVKKNAVPVKVKSSEIKEPDNVPEPNTSEDNPSDIKLTNSAEEVSTEVDNDTPDLECHDSDLESILESPKKNKLRQQATMYKKRLQTQTRKMKTLSQKVRRLNKRNAYLKSILQELKDKNLDGH